MRCHADELIYRPRASSTWSGDPVLVRRPTRAHVLGTFFAEERRGGRLLFASFLDAPIPQDENGPSTGAETTEGPLDPHGHPFKQNKVCGHVLAAGEQRCCEKRTVDACHECCIKKSFDGIEGEPTSDTCRRTCIRMCYKGLGCRAAYDWSMFCCMLGEAKMPTSLGNISPDAQMIQTPA
ncbi:Uncharacterized protein SCF082_LOCUS1234 [Durusdinium trenchii]|uniref:SREBP regulating gene protein n=1 Tax=Durusdinium trenchii TaxID=1381693 RepID=A0ABP0HCV9_9DINO